MRVNVTLACTECGDRNYISTINKRKSENFEGIFHLLFLSLNTNLMTLVTINVIMLSERNG